jgi:hypothetical protein
MTLSYNTVGFVRQMEFLMQVPHCAYMDVERPVVEFVSHKAHLKYVPFVRNAKPQSMCANALNVATPKPQTTCANGMCSKHPFF